eukprot:442381_1
MTLKCFSKCIVYIFIVMAILIPLVMFKHDLYSMYLITDTNYITTNLGNVSELSETNLYQPQWNCSTIYIDLGSNIGVQSRKLFEPNLYLGNRRIQQYDNILGNIETRRKDCCVFSFEANPAHKQRLKEIETCYGEKGWKIHFDIKAVWVTDNELITIHTNANDTHEDWAASIFDKVNGFTEPESIYRVKTVDIANWTLNLINIHKPNKILMKMDIEGAEYQVLPQMFQKGILCSIYIDTIYIEIHKVPTLKKISIKSLLKKIRQQKECQPTNIVEKDDETYLHDGFPLPCEKI